MQNYSLFSLVKHAVSHHQNWEKAWENPQLRSQYDVVIIGGGGHGLATAYYLAKEHGITNVAVVEAGWIGGGNTGRNTMVVRSNYLFPQSTNFYEFALQQYEKMSRELNFNVMLRQGGMLSLMHSQHQLETMRRNINAMHMNGVDANWLSRKDVGKMVPSLDISTSARHPILGAILQKRGGIARHDGVAWAYARAASALGVHIIQQCPVTGFDIQNGAVQAVQTAQGTIKTSKVALAVAGHSSVLAAMAGFRLPITSLALQAMVSEPLKPVFDATIMSPSLGVYISQSDKGEMVMGGALDMMPSYAQRGSIDTIEQVVAAILELFPRLSRVKLMRAWAGIVDVVHDSSPIIGLSPVAGIYLNCGFGTGGFKAIPAGGWTLADTVANDRPHQLVEDFCLNRFETGAFIDEMGAAGISH